MEEPGTELVLLGLVILLDEAVRLKRLKQPVDSRARDPQPVRQLADAEPPGPAGERAEDPRGAIDRLDRPFRPAGPRRSELDCGLVVGFGIVEWPSMM